LCENNRDLLPANLPRPSTQTRELQLLAHRCRRAAGKFSTVLALPTGELA
jgi:hypothetical protein